MAKISYKKNLVSLVKGRKTDLAELHNSKFVKRFREIEHFDVEEQDAVLQILDTMIMKNKMTGVMSLDAN